MTKEIENAKNFAHNLRCLSTDYTESDQVSVNVFKETIIKAAQTIDELLKQLEAACLSRDEWKANHDNQVNLKRMLMDRPDLKERAKLIQKLITHIDELEKQIKEMKEGKIKMKG